MKLSKTLRAIYRKVTMPIFYLGQFIPFYKPSNMMRNGNGGITEAPKHFIRKNHNCGAAKRCECVVLCSLKGGAQ